MKAIANLIPELFDKSTGKYKESDTTGLSRFYFTFSKGDMNAGKYVLLYSESWDSARDEMTQFFGKTWAFQYEHKDWINECGVSVAEQYNLSKIEIKPLNCN